MKIDYIRNMQTGYMRIAVEESLSRLEEEMLSNNVVEGMLPICWQMEDNRYLLRYDITGKQALDMLFENSMADDEILKALISGVCVAIKQLERYLLQQEGLLLRPETIFWDYKTKTMHFCYCPAEQERLQERFKRLMEYILVKTDHKNLKAVELAYGLYDELQRPAFTLQNLQDYIDMGIELPETEYVEQEGNGSVDHLENKEEIIPQIETCTQSYTEEKSVLGLWERTKAKCMAWIKDKIPKGPQKRREPAPIVFEPEEEVICQGLPTVLLAERISGIEGVLKYEGEQNLPDIKITKTPFIIGGDVRCDGVINEPVISRQHARITKMDDVYFIEDLNSTNGTIVDGGMLNYKTRVSIKAGTSIMFANVPYVFR